VSPDLGSSNHQRLLPEGEKMTKNEILTENDVQCKQAKHTIRKALQFPKLATQQDEIEMHDARRTLYATSQYCSASASSANTDTSWLAI
jgi:hypothetical protein